MIVRPVLVEDPSPSAVSSRMSAMADRQLRRPAPASRSSRSRKNWPVSERSTSTIRSGEKLQQLAADLRADAAGAAGDQQHAVVDPLADVVHLQLDRLAAQAGR